MEIKVDDRVAVYQYIHEYGEGHPGHAKKSIWVVRKKAGDLVFCATELSLNLSWFHVKQCRRLKPKAKPREFEINVTQGIIGIIAFGAKALGPNERIRVREVFLAQQAANRSEGNG